jgi:hypothetical protein
MIKMVSVNVPPKAIPASRIAAVTDVPAVRARTPATKPTTTPMRIASDTSNDLMIVGWFMFRPAF